MANEQKQAAAPAPDRADSDRLDAAVRSAAARRESQKDSAQRERAPVPGGLGLKLSVYGTVDGYHLYWENDENGAIEQLLYEGFEFVDPSEVKMASAFVVDGDVSHRLSRYVGKRDDGGPLRAYLMKCPDEIWAERERVRYQMADKRDAAIRQSVDKPGEGRYNLQNFSPELNTQYRKEH